MVEMSGPIVRVRTGGLLAVVAILVVIAVVLGGCGGSTDSLASKSATEILAASRTAAREASAVHVKSQIFYTTAIKRSKAKGKPKIETKLVPISMDELQLTSGGGHARVVFFGSEIEAIRVGKTLYVKGGPRFYRSLARRAGVHLAPGTWLKAPANGSQLIDFAALTEAGGELTLLLRDPTLSLTKGHTITIDGQEAIELKERGKLYTGAIYIATTGKPYPIEILKRGEETGHTTFTAWNQPVTLSAPSDAVELSQLEHKAH